MATATMTTDGPETGFVVFFRVYCIYFFFLFFPLLTHNARFSSMTDMAVVDLEVIKARTAVSSETTGTHDGFREDLLKRDLCCIFTGHPPNFGEGFYIIPYRRGSDVRSSLPCIEWPSNRLAFLWSFQWFKLIIENRPHDDDDDTRGLDDISDIRNGFFGTNMIHSIFDKREFVILKVDANLLFP